MGSGGRSGAGCTHPQARCWGSLASPSPPPRAPGMLGAGRVWDLGWQGRVQSRAAVMLREQYGTV